MEESHEEALFPPILYGESMFGLYLKFDHVRHLSSDYSPREDGGLSELGLGI